MRIISSDSTSRGYFWFCGSRYLTYKFHNLYSFYNHSYHWCLCHHFHSQIKYFLIVSRHHFSYIFIMMIQKISIWVNHFNGRYM